MPSVPGKKQPWVGYEEGLEVKEVMGGGKGVGVTGSIGPCGSL